MEKDTKEDKTIGSLEKDTVKPTGSLEKDAKEAKPTGSLEKDTGRKKNNKPIMVVDWHNTIEKQNRVSFQNEKALNKLMDYADVHILSYVETQWRENEVHKQVSPRTRSKLKGVHCCYERVGPHGKLGCRKLFLQVACLWERAPPRTFGKGCVQELASPSMACLTD